METTTIQISRELQKKLEARKLSLNESYENVIEDLLEDTMELSEETKNEIGQSRKEYKEGKVHKWAHIKRELKLNV